MQAVQSDVNDLKSNFLEIKGKRVYVHREPERCAEDPEQVLINERVQIRDETTRFPASE